MHEVLLTVVGNVVADPELSETSNGVPFTAFRVASTSRWFDRRVGEMVKGDSLFLEVRCWRGLAATAVESLVKGSPVIVQGRLRSRTVPADSDGQQRRTFTQLDAQALGLDLARLPMAHTSASDLRTGETGVAA